MTILPKVVSQQIETVVGTAPYLGGVVALTVATTPMAGDSLLGRGVGGAMSAAIMSGVFEYTYNRKEHAPGVKWAIISESAMIGAAAGMVGPMIFGTGNLGRVMV